MVCSLAIGHVGTTTLNINHINYKALSTRHCCTRPSFPPTGRQSRNITAPARVQFPLLSEFVDAMLSTLRHSPRGSSDEESDGAIVIDYSDGDRQQVHSETNTAITGIASRASSVFTRGSLPVDGDDDDEQASAEPSDVPTPPPSVPSDLPGKPTKPGKQSKPK